MVLIPEIRQRAYWAVLPTLTPSLRETAGQWKE
jgi:hypothetical protein